MGTREKKRIFIIEDNVAMLALFQISLRDHVEIVTASSVKGAKEIFDTSKDPFHLLAIDGTLVHHLDTLEMVTYFREDAKFEGDMVAISGTKDSNKKLKDAGCNHSCDKHKFPDFLKGWLLEN